MFSQTQNAYEEGSSDLCLFPLDRQTVRGCLIEILKIVECQRGIYLELLLPENLHTRIPEHGKKIKHRSRLEVERRSFVTEGQKDGTLA